MSKRAPITKDDILGIETRHATYCYPPKNGMPDMHVVKEIVHTKDGRKIPHVRLMENYQIPYWITKKGMRNHKEKKESEKQEHLDYFESTRAKMLYDIKGKLWPEKQRSLNDDNFNLKKQVYLSPYLYGVDIMSTATLKKKQNDRFPELSSPNSVAATDTETDMLHGTEEIIMQTISFKERVFTAIKSSFLKGRVDPEARLQEMLIQYLGDDVKERNIKWEIQFVDTAADVVVAVMDKAHQWKPDFLAIWNKEFDMRKMLEALKAADIDPANVFSDPKVPYAYRHFDFKLGSPTRIKSDGTTMSLTPSQRWHVTTCPASFVVIDAMCAYRQIRTGEQEEPSYSLDYLMDLNIKRQKLKFDKAEGYHHKEWHEFMQLMYPLEYVVYNVFDCVGMEILDEKTTDLAIKISMFSGCTDYANFPSQPKRLCNEFHWHLLENGEVLGTTSSEMRDANDARTVDGKNWIN